MSDRYEIREISDMRHIFDLRVGRPISAESTVIRLNRIERVEEKVRSLRQALQDTMEENFISEAVESE